MTGPAKQRAQRTNPRRFVVDDEDRQRLRSSPGSRSLFAADVHEPPYAFDLDDHLVTVTQ